MGRHNVRVNAVSPGVIATEMSGELIKNKGAQLLENIPLRRLGEPQEVAAVVSFLGCEAASYVTGQVISVDGGLV